MFYTSSTAQGGGGSFKNRKPIGEIGCCESPKKETLEVLRMIHGSQGFPILLYHQPGQAWCLVGLPGSMYYIRIFLDIPPLRMPPGWLTKPSSKMLNKPKMVNLEEEIMNKKVGGGEIMKLIRWLSDMLFFS